MLAASPALTNFLITGQPFVAADLYVVTLVSGTKLFLTSLDRAVTYTGLITANPDYGTNTYLSLGQSSSGVPLIQRSRINKSVGQSSKVDLTIYASPGVYVLNQQILTTIALGYWSNAQVWIRRAFILPTDIPSNWNTPIPTNLGGTGDGTVVWFLGYVGAISKLGMLSVEMEVRDLLWYLNRPLPKNLYSPGCYHTLFDAGCTLSKAAFTHTGTILSGSSSTQVLVPETEDQGIPSPPVWGSNPISTNNVNFTVNPQVYYVQSTYVTSLGETAPSVEWILSVAKNNLIQVAPPPSVSGVSYWNCYVGTETGDEQLQQAIIPIANSWVEGNGGLDLTGVGPPQFATNGYWSLGVLTVTYNSGSYSGQSYSSFIETSVWNGSSTTLTLRVPLPQAPLSTDSYSVIPGCDKRSSTCGQDPTIGGTGGGGGKFGNLLHHGGHEWIPVPETGM